jgi:alkanesulfonate monooxygenase SsuD/methylene tetrahydromethanopterin reductase-like flavin-dependent oxidoreductase (luciferase family)
MVIYEVDFIYIKGKYHKFSGYAQTHPSPQRTPALFQAGSSSSGINFAGKHAEGIYCGGPNIPHVLKYSQSVREAAKAHGRDPNSIKLFAGISPIIGRTEEEAVAKYKLAKSKVSPIAGLALFCDFTGIDLLKWDLDEPFSIDDDAEGSASIQGVFKNFKGIKKDAPWTP